MTRIEAKKVEYIKTREDLARVILDLVMFFQQGYEMEIDLIAYQDRDAAWAYEVGSTRQMLEIAEEHNDKVTAMQMRSKLAKLEADSGREE